MGADGAAGLAQFTFIPLRLNTATDEDFMTIPGVGKRMVGEFKEYRPWKTKEQFEKEIGKYVNAKEVAAPLALRCYRLAPLACARGSRRPSF